MNSKYSKPLDPIESASLPSWVLIIDDHPLFCDALKLTLGSIANFNKIVAVDNLQAAISELSTSPLPSLILLDLNLPDASGLNGLLKLKRVADNCPIIIVSSMTDTALIEGAITAGASGYVPKHSHRSVFKQAIDMIKEGGQFKPHGFTENVSTTVQDTVISRLASLTNQQARILELICEGKLNKQIAFELTIAETTVKAHVTAIMRKLQVHSRTQAVLVAQEAKYTESLPSS
ncbi:two component transcriptional regulator, LuxR family protein [Rhodobacterales bacterium HTCC2150]|nr:two component transcriptional regulator, LuxR family protein [Rhodobacterales bacterium HTCC2150] [Rhodobacteraceae bacterium HTCC2150]